MYILPESTSRFSPSFFVNNNLIKKSGTLLTNTASASWKSVSVSSYSYIQIGIKDGTSTLRGYEFIAVGFAGYGSAANPIFIRSNANPNTVIFQYYVSGTTLYYFTYSGYTIQIYGI